MLQLGPGTEGSRGKRSPGAKHQPDPSANRSQNLIIITIIIPSIHPMSIRTSWGGGGKTFSSLLGWRGQNILRREFRDWLGWVVNPNVL